MADKSILIIGAGIAGLCTGVYAQQNGYASRIVEMHTLPGGLATAWKRRGYTIDGCIHWVVGSSPQYKPMHQFWREVGLLDGLTIIDQDIFAVFEDRSGRVMRMYTDPDRLEKEMIAVSPQDTAVIREFCDGIRFCVDFEPPMGDIHGLADLVERGMQMLRILPKVSIMQKWVKLTAKDFTERFQSPLLRFAVSEMWLPEFSMFFMLMTLAWAHKKTAGYPLGGTMPLIRNVERRYLELGGQIQYGKKVEKILVENNKAVGVRLVDGSELRADTVISCADGHATIFDMLEGKYLDDTIRGYYRNYKPFPPILLIGLGVKRTFNDDPQSISGIMFELDEPVRIGPKTYARLPVHVYNFDPTLAPEGKTSATIALVTEYAYWKALGANEALYTEKKKEIAALIPRLLEQRWPGISAQIETIDVATPNTFERYTGNWQGSFEGWIMTPEIGIKGMKRTLPGLENFYMAGQWVAPGGGLPAGVMTGREAIQMVCKKDGRRFRTTIKG